MRVLGDSGRAEDAVQDAFMNVWNRAATFDAERGSLRAWLLTSVRNRCIDYLRGRGAHERQERELQPELAYAVSTSDPWREVALSLERAAVRDAMASLPTEQRQVVEMAYFGGYTHAEIAGMTRVPLGTVKGRMRLALEKTLWRPSTRATSRWSATRARPRSPTPARCFCPTPTAAARPRH